jgi:hypothetical protein
VPWSALVQRGWASGAEPEERLSAWKVHSPQLLYQGRCRICQTYPVTGLEMLGFLRYCQSRCSWLSLEEELVKRAHNLLR